MSLTAERLRQLLHYDPETGIFTRLDSTTRSDLIGMAAGNISAQGHIMIYVDGKSRWAHRLAFLWMTGDWPRNQIDHINRVRHDNRWANLREATHAENNRNSRARRNGLKGATERHGKFIAQIKVNGRNKYLGIFDTEEAAHSAYCAAAKEQFGEYARTR